VCGSDIHIIAFTVDPGPIRDVRAHVGEPTEPPPESPSRRAPTEAIDLAQAHHARDVMKVSPDELPVNDIHAL
jgi:hypothetical protein